MNPLTHYPRKACLLLYGSSVVTGIVVMHVFSQMRPGLLTSGFYAAGLLSTILGSMSLAAWVADYGVRRGWWR